MRHAKAQPGYAGMVVAALAVGLLAVFVGLVSASGFVVGQLVIFGLLLGCMLLLLPMSTLFVVLLVVTLALQGVATYFLRLPQAAWMPYLLCILLSVKAVDLSARQTGGNMQFSVWSATPVVLLCLYVLTLLFAIVLNRVPLFQAVIGLKNALPMWVAAALVYQGARTEGFLDRIWSLAKIVFFVQLPVVLYQRLVIAPGRRFGASAADAVVGTFGGLIDAGGQNATLVLFVLLVMAYQLSLWAREQAKLSTTLAYWLVGMVILLSGEVKATFLWLPLVLLYVMRRRIFSSFGAAIATFSVGTLLVLVTATAYSAMYWGGWKTTHTPTNIEFLDRMSYFFDPHNINYQTGEISRGASLALWANDARGDVVHKLVGNGPGASRISATGGLGEVARRFAPLAIASTSVAMLLWDAGLVGVLAFVGMLASMTVALHRASSSGALSAKERSQAEALAALMLMFLSLLFYNRSLNDEPSVQLLLAICLGCALHWNRKMFTAVQSTHAPALQT